MTAVRRVALVVSAGVVLTAGAPAWASPARVPEPAPTSVATVATPSVSRISGADRYATSVSMNRAAFATGTHPDVVYLVSGTTPYVSLSATPAAVAHDGGVLLTAPSGIPAVVATELKRLGPKSIVVVGSTAILSSTVASQARSYAPVVTRLGGADRYQTAQAIVRHAFAAGSATHAWIATGQNWADGMVAGAAAAAHGEPLLTVQGTATTLSADVVGLIHDLGLTSITVVGNRAGISTGIETQLDGILGAAHVDRATGPDRYAIAARANAKAFPTLAPGTAYVANGGDFTTALAGAFLAGRTKRPLYYSVPFCLPAAVRPPLTASAVTRVTLLGAERSLRSLVGTLEPCHSLTAASEPWVLVNKRNALRPKSFVPSGLVVPKVTYPNGQRLRSTAATALVQMFAAARREGAGRMSIASGYRSYTTQYSVYWHRVSTNGRAYADKWIARPGFSEHQSGLSLDIAPVGNPSCSAHNCIGSTPQGVWLKRNAWRFGFVLRYESGFTSVTGYNSEPWHFRYVGTPLSTAYSKGGWHTLEQFFGHAAAPTY